MVRFLLVLLIAMVLLAMAGTAFAYRLICIPTGEVLPEGIYKLEFSAPHNDNGTDAWLPSYRFDGAVGNGFEIAVKGGCAPDRTRATNTQVNLNWQIAKETADMPGYGVGIWNWYDSDDHKANKESFFAGAFKTVKVPGMKYPVKFFLAAGTEQLNGMFGGVAIPLSKRFSAAAEYVPTGKKGCKSLMLPGEDSHLVWALGYNQTPNWRFKYANVGGDSAWGVVYTSKWLQK